MIANGWTPQQPGSTSGSQPQLWFGGARTTIPWSEAAALSGCCAYLLLFALPIGWDLPLAMLAVVALFSDTNTHWDVHGPGKYITAGLVLLIGATLASTMMSSNLRQSALGSAPMLPAILLYWIVRYRLRASHARALLLSLLALAAIVSLSIMVAWYVGTSQRPHVWIHALSRIVSVPNDTLILAVLSPVAVAILFSETNKVLRAAAILTLLLAVIAIVLARSRLAIITLFVAQFVTLVAARRFPLRWLLATAVAACAADAISGLGLLHKFTDTTSESRIALWWAATAMFLDAPVLGQGPNMFGGLRMAFVTTFQETNRFGIEPGFVAWPHNVYLELLAERGIFAFAGFCTALLVALNAAWVLCRNASGDVRTTAIGSFGALATITFAGIAELSLLHLWVPVIAFTFFGLVAMLDSSGRSLP